MENNIEKNVEQAEEIIASGETERSVVEKKPFPWWIIIVAAVAVIALVVVLVVAILPKEEEPVYTDYTVTVVDGIGTPVPRIHGRLSCHGYREAHLPTSPLRARAGR